METKHPSMLGLLLETHIGLERQGPGSAEAIFPVQLLVLICSLILLISLIEMQKSEIWKKKAMRWTLQTNACTMKSTFPMQEGLRPNGLKP